MKLIVTTFQDAESLVKVLSKYYYTRMIEIKDDLGRTQCWWVEYKEDNNELGAERQN